LSFSNSNPGWHALYNTDKKPDASLVTLPQFSLEMNRIRSAGNLRFPWQPPSFRRKPPKSR